MGMLVLSRKEGEQIKVGDDIVITITQVKGQRARVGIDAPSDVRILRAELEGTEAATPNDTDCAALPPLAPTSV